jgi:hypothetical protein
MRLKWQFVTMALLSLSLGACIPTSQTPISDPEKAQPDPQLTGVWRMQEENGSVHYVHIGTEKKNALDTSRQKPEAGLMRMVSISHDKEDGELGDPTTLRSFTSEVDGTRYLNVAMDPEEGAMAGSPIKYIFVKYRVEGDQLHLRLMDLKKTAAAIESNQLVGEVKYEDGNLREVKLKATPEQLRAFLASDNAKAVFPQEGTITYQRVK